MARHSTRAANGRFTSSGAPIDPDDSVYEHVNAPSAAPLREHARPMETVYAEPAHDPASGYGPLRPRRAVVIDAQTGQQLDAHITDVRAVDRYVGGSRTNAHLEAAEGDPFVENLMGARHGDYAETRSYRAAPGTNGYRVPAMGQSDREAGWRGGH